MLSQTAARVRYTGNGVTTVFAYPFYVLDSTTTQLKVVYKASASASEVVWTEGVNYSVTGIGLPAGGTVIAAVAPANGSTLAIFRNVPPTQDVDYIDGDSFSAAITENALDKAAMLDTMWLDRWDRSLKLNDTDGLAGGIYQGGGNRITGLVDPVDDTDAATKVWVLSQISNPVGWTPNMGVAQFNANKLQGRDISAGAPTDGQALRWSLANNRWEPATIVDGSQLITANNTWTGTNTYSAAVTMNAGLTLGTAATSLTFNTTSQRIKGLFSGTPYASRTLFMPVSGSAPCNVGAIPTGVNEAGYDCFGAADPNNAPILHIAASATACVIDTGKTGAGAVQPLTLQANGSGGIRIQTNGRLAVNTTTDNGAQINVNGTISRQAGTFRAHRNGVTQSMTDSAFTKVQCGTEDYDQAGWYDAATNYRYQPLIAGKYLINFGLGMDTGVVANKRLASVLYKNGVAHRLGNNTHTSSTAPVSSIGAATVDANGSTDYFELYCFHNMGAPTNINGLATDCFLEGFHIG